MLACARNTRARYKCILESWLLIIASPSSRKKRKGGERVQIIIKRRKEDGKGLGERRDRVQVPKSIEIGSGEKKRWSRERIFGTYGVTRWQSPGSQLTGILATLRALPDIAVLDFGYCGTIKDFFVRCVASQVFIWIVGRDICGNVWQKVLFCENIRRKQVW